MRHPLPARRIYFHKSPRVPSEEAAPGPGLAHLPLPCRVYSKGGILEVGAVPLQDVSLPRISHAEGGEDEAAPEGDPEEAGPGRFCCSPIFRMGVSLIKMLLLPNVQLL